MARLLIIADDFTGALDTGVQLSQKGITTQVVVHKTMDWNALNPNAEILVVDTGSRHLEAQQAYRRVFELCKQAKKAGIKYFYKKTDSTLRGNIGAELSALMDACNLHRLPFIPGYPETGRTTKGGYQYVDGVPLHQTIFATDPLNPIDDAYIPNIIKKQSDKTVLVAGKPHIGVEELLAKEKSICVLDSIDELEMEEISKELIKKKDITAIAGCAGFARYLDKVFPLKISQVKRELAYKPILAVIGSVNQVSIGQVQYAEKAGVKSQILDPIKLIDESYIGSPTYRAHIEAAVQGINNHGCLIIKTVRNREDVMLVKDEKGTFSKQDLYEGITESIGCLVSEVIKRVKIGTLLVFGGDTALGIIHQLSCTSIMPGHEVLTGVPLSTIESSTFNGTLITKAGGFGKESALIDIMTYVERGK
ncbi:MAG TPA: four-carbon acid sugar kinase family protein [Clostridia bacterium]|nr:four-carbon acid sugar kinase family protein [Clostridia bacterium]